MDHLQRNLCSGSCEISSASHIEEQMRERFRNVAKSPRGLFSYPTGREGLLALGYDRAALSTVPE